MLIVYGVSRAGLGVGDGYIVGLPRPRSSLIFFYPQRASVQAKEGAGLSNHGAVKNKVSESRLQDRLRQQQQQQQQHQDERHS